MYAGNNIPDAPEVQRAMGTGYESAYEEDIEVEERDWWQDYGEDNLWGDLPNQSFRISDVTSLAQEGFMVECGNGNAERYNFDRRVRFGSCLKGGDIA